MIKKLSLPPGLPSNFSPAGFVYWAQFFPGEPGHIKPSKPRGARAEGIRYEKKVQKFLSGAHWGEYKLIASPWIIFRTGESKRDRFCQPDALLINTETKHIVVIEVKLQHTQVAWWQVRQLYEPVLRVIYPGYSFTPLEIVRWLDTRAAFPETFRHCENILPLTGPQFGVHIYDPRFHK